MSFTNSATAYLPLSCLFTFQSLISSARSSTQSQIQAYKLRAIKEPVQEIKQNTVSEKLSDQPNAIIVQAAIHHPTSMVRFPHSLNSFRVEPILLTELQTTIGSYSSSPNHQLNSTHPLLAFLYPLSLGGVADPSTFRVYGRANVRVDGCESFSYGDEDGSVNLMHNSSSSSGGGSGSTGSGRDTGGGAMAIMGGLKVDVMMGGWVGFVWVWF
ncbi:hypothetical protein K435DRAFT_867652 [Dendrothele bispora CBS 962.96]|uniref:Uncharacterized protein n=1 Tax=Dendrothele bispora (strain CBS 962.96) TaxID=1314807 RepID=A0A4S8LDR4_DENBC|nr:hypothetical protein K435DRAFT_867652 [Dendrothele bispora CBS 962.96]